MERGAETTSISTCGFLAEKAAIGTLHLPALIAVRVAHRELVTFCLIAAQGGCGPQLRGHAADNLSVGNPYELLVRVVSSNLPFIGCPRILNASAALDAAASPARLCTPSVRWTSSSSPRSART